MALSEGRAVAGEVVKAADLNQIIDALEGDTDETLAYHLRTESGEDFIITLPDAAGGREFQIKDSAGVTVFSVDSDGNVTQAGSFDPGSLTLPVSTNPTPTTEGAMAWDNDDDHLIIGTGSTQAVFIPRNKVWRLVGADVTERSSSSGGSDLSTISWSESIPANVPMLVRFSFRTTAVSNLLGFKLNGSSVLPNTNPGIAASSVGWAEIIIPPRETNYLQAATMSVNSHIVDSTTVTGNRLAASVNAPTDPITSITITGGPTGSSGTFFIKNVYVYRLAIQ